MAGEFMDEIYAFLRTYDEARKSPLLEPQDKSVRELTEKPTVYYRPPERGQEHGIWRRECEWCGFKQIGINTAQFDQLPSVIHKCTRNEQTVYVYWRAY